MDGCADVGGCFEAPFALMELFSEAKNPKGGCAFLVIIGLIASGIAFFQPKPEPHKPKPGIVETIKDDVKRAYNRRKIERAEQEFHSQQEATSPSVAPVQSETKWNRAKDWLRERLNKDYEHRHPDEGQ